VFYTHPVKHRDGIKKTAIFSVRVNMKFGTLHQLKIISWTCCWTRRWRKLLETGITLMSGILRVHMEDTDDLYFYKKQVGRDFFLNNQRDALIIQIYSVIKLYMFRKSSLPVIRSFLLYIRHW